MPDTVIIVPARLASIRFPKKLLHVIHGKPLILWTAERIAGQAPELPLFFAVADKELLDLLEENGFRSILTDSGLPSGTDRVAEANREIGADFVINVQADEPLVTGSQINRLNDLIHGGADMATMAIPFDNADDFNDPNKVKVALGKDGRALYFSRSPIPYNRDDNRNTMTNWKEQNMCCLHLGLYAYKADFLETYHSLPPGRLEQMEKLEQLRALENGYAISVGLTDDPAIGIDSLEDADAFAEIIGKKS